MSIFSTKLNDIHKTLSLTAAFDAASLATALSGGLSRLAIAVGSGGSAISAEYLRVCRNTLGAAITLVQTPMEFVLGAEVLSQADVFLFSANGNNPDILAAFEAASSRQAAAIHIVTNNPEGELARRCTASLPALVHVLPVADPKDGFLATHSLTSFVAGLLFASNHLNQVDRTLADHFLMEANERLAPDERERCAQSFASLRQEDTLVLLQDPRLAPLGLLIETSAWEAGLCSVQRTDHRNFAHGRHVWPAKRPAQTMLLSLTGTETHPTWHQIDAQLPTNIRRHSVEFGNCGRYQNALGVFSALTIVEALGRTTGIDPGKPGVGPFARDLYEATVLQNVAAELPSAVRQKRAAVLSQDEPSWANIDLSKVFADLRSRFKSAVFAGLVLDYDGTIVSIEGRFDPPAAEIVGELNRLLGEDVPLAIATGRGGSAGEQLREVLSPAHQANILMGYYNGAYIRSLDVDIRNSPPPLHPAMERVHAWLDLNPSLFVNHAFKRGALQAAIEIAHLRDAIDFQREFQATFDRLSDVRMTRSGHTIDICPVETCKTAVVQALASQIGASPESILCIGDSGGLLGNDHVMLGMPYGVSVDHVCGRLDVCWSFFGYSKTGPKALLHLLRALKRDSDGLTKLDVDALLNDGTSGTKPC